MPRPLRTTRVSRGGSALQPIEMPRKARLGPTRLGVHSRKQGNPGLHKWDRVSRSCLRKQPGWLAHHDATSSRHDEVPRPRLRRARRGRIPQPRSLRRVPRCVLPMRERTQRCLPHCRFRRQRFGGVRVRRVGGEAGRVQAGLIARQGDAALCPDPARRPRGDHPRHHHAEESAQIPAQDSDSRG